MYPTLDHYHEPLVSLDSIDRGRAKQPRVLPGIDLRIRQQLELLAIIAHADELAEIARTGTTGDELAPTFDNLAFGAGDAEILYSLIRHLKPARVVEVGSGHSTRFAKAALDRNRAEGGAAVHLCIEPYESPWLEQLGLEVLRQPVEEVDGRFFASLSPGDILFIDSSHVVRPQGDVLHLVHDVLPNLPPGVLVHIHDVFTPRDYPVSWMERRWFWTEQYLIEALLVESPRYEVVLALNHLFYENNEALTAVCPVLREQGEKAPSSFWIRVRQ